MAGPERSEGGVELVPFDFYRPDQLGEVLSAMVHRNTDALTPHYPGVVERYWGEPQAAASVERAIARAATEACGYYAVRLDGQEAGVASFQQGSVPHPRVARVARFLPGSLTPNVVEGPNVAYWLDDERNQERFSTDELRAFGAQTLSLLALEAASSPRTDGYLWTVERPDNTEAIAVVEASTDPAFHMVGEERPWLVGDGVVVPRRLYVGNETVEKIRESAAA
ncbi:hypothetical protein JNJ66_03130 [Candidatus Saccharibacteria bacterium]|nr:hypothetical protein [Candidatus Saccharibacteria bacterium]